MPEISCVHGRGDAAAFFVRTLGLKWCSEGRDDNGSAMCDVIGVVLLWGWCAGTHTRGFGRPFCESRERPPFFFPMKTSRIMGAAQRGARRAHWSMYACTRKVKIMSDGAHASPWRVQCPGNTSEYLQYLYGGPQRAHGQDHSRLRARKLALTKGYFNTEPAKYTRAHTHELLSAHLSYHLSW